MLKSFYLTHQINFYIYYMVNVVVHEFQSLDTWLILLWMNVKSLNIFFYCFLMKYIPYQTIVNRDHFY